MRLMKIAGFGQDAGIAGMMRPPFWDRPLHLVGAREHKRKALMGKQGKVARAINNVLDDQMHDAFFASLHEGRDPYKARAHHDLSEPLHQRGPYYEIGDPAFIFNRHEHNAFGAAGLLPDQNHARDPHAFAVNKRFDLMAWQNALRRIKRA